MKKIFFLFLFSIFASHIQAQEDSTKVRDTSRMQDTAMIQDSIPIQDTIKIRDTGSVLDTARAFMRKGDYANASFILSKAIELQPGNIEISKMLALSYYFQQDNKKAIEIIGPVLLRKDADIESFQLGGNIYKAMEMPGESERIYKMGIKKFPESGALYNGLGEALWAQKNNEAIKQWEKGIKKDPAFAGNYYNAAMFYFIEKENIWCILYGEIFINMDPLNIKIIEIKDLLPQSYQRIFEGTGKEQNSKNDFVKAVLKTFNKQAEIAAQGINAETLAMIRIRFILDWYINNEPRFPYRLFEYQKELLNEGLYDAYHQWLFGAMENLVGFQKWVQEHNTEYNAFMNFQKEHIFQIPAEQGYH